MRNLIICLAFIGLLSACKNDHQEKKETDFTYKDALASMQKNDSKSVVIVELIETPNYSYIKYELNGKEQWGAISARPIEIGKTYYFKEAFEMKNFQSKALDRIFPSIWFINDFSDEAINATSPKDNQDDHTKENKDIAKGVDEHTKVAKAEGGYSLAEVFEKKSQLKNQEIIVKGKVVKINLQIMNSNWFHIQDGTSYNKVFDLTVTTKEDIHFQVGDIVTLKGKLVLNKDFGYGYKYDYLIEDALIIK